MLKLNLFTMMNYPVFREYELAKEYCNTYCCTITIDAKEVLEGA